MKFNITDEKQGLGMKQIKHTRVMATFGKEMIIINTRDIGLFSTQNDLVYVTTTQGKKYRYDCRLSTLENELDPHQFFRISRQYIINIDIIKSYRVYNRVRLQVFLYLEEVPFIFVSQQTAAKFKHWLNGLHFSN